MSKILLRIIADTNDADYVEQTSHITELELAKIAHVAAAIKKFKPYTVTIDGLNIKHDHNFPTGDCLREDLGEKSAFEYYSDVSEDYFETFMNCVPSSEYGTGIHTITSIRAMVVITDEELLK